MLAFSKESLSQMWLSFFIPQDVEIFSVGKSVCRSYMGPASVVSEPVPHTIIQGVNESESNSSLESSPHIPDRAPGGFHHQWTSGQSIFCPWLQQSNAEAACTPQFRLKGKFKAYLLMRHTCLPPLLLGLELWMF